MTNYYFATYLLSLLLSVFPASHMCSSINHSAVYIIPGCLAFHVFVLHIKQTTKVPLSCAGQAGAAHLFVPLRHLPVQQRPGEGGQEPLQAHLLGVVAAPQRQQELPELPLHPQPRRGMFLHR